MPKIIVIFIVFYC